jgi:hypothetical protein
MQTETEMKPDFRAPTAQNELHGPQPMAPEESLSLSLKWLDPRSVSSTLSPPMR